MTSGGRCIFWKGRILMPAIATGSLLLSSSLPANAARFQLADRSEPEIVAQKTTNAVCPAQLETAIAQITNRPQFGRSRWGILVQTLAPNPANRRTLFARDAEKFFVPASNTKLLTTAAALHKLGAQYRIRTSLYGLPNQTRLTSLRIVGRGDPSLTPAQLTALAQQLRNKGIRQVNQLLGDDSYFRGSAVHPNWDWEDVQAGYGAPVNSLILNQNEIGLTLVPQKLGQPLQIQWDDPSEVNQWRIDNQSTTVGANAEEFVEVGRDFSQPVLWVRGQLRVSAEPETAAISVPNPGNYLLQKFRGILNTAGISVGRTALTTTAIAPTEQELASVESPPLAQLLMELNQESNNLYAEALLKTLGSLQPGASRDATEAGLAVVKSTLTELGVNPASYSMVDGSGLARRNLVSPEALVQTLQAIARSPEAAIYRASLPVAGVSGTLRSRFRNTPVQGIVQAKTGTLTGVVALSGYLTSPNYPPLAFSIIVNNSNQPTADARSAVDEIVLVLARLRSC